MEVNEFVDKINALKDDWPQKPQPHEVEKAKKFMKNVAAKLRAEVAEIDMQQRGSNVSKENHEFFLDLQRATLYCKYNTKHRNACGVLEAHNLHLTHDSFFLNKNQGATGEGLAEKCVLRTQWYLLGPVDESLGPYDIDDLREHHSGGYLPDIAQVRSGVSGYWKPLSSILGLSAKTGAQNDAMEEEKAVAIEAKAVVAVEEAVEGARDASMEEAKDDAMEEAKADATEAKDDATEEAKDDATEAKDDATEEAKDDATEAKDDATEEAKDDATEEAKDDATEEAKDDALVKAKDDAMEAKTDDAVDGARDDSMEEAKDDAMEAKTDDAVEEARDASMEEAKDDAMEEAKADATEAKADDVVEEAKADDAIEEVADDGESSTARAKKKMKLV